MKVIWTEGAAEDLEEIADYIRRDSEEAANRVAKALYNGAMSLSNLPNRGRKRIFDDAYELLITPWRYFAIYEIVGHQVVIQGFVHTSRDRSR